MENIINIDTDNQDHQTDKQFVHGFLIDLFVDLSSAYPTKDSADDHSCQQQYFYGRQPA